MAPENTGKAKEELKDAANTISNQQMVIRELKQYIDDINTPTEGFKY